MSEHRFNSYEDFIRAVAESKAAYDAKRSELSWEEKDGAGKLKVKPWPIKRRIQG